MKWRVVFLGLAALFLLVPAVHCQSDSMLHVNQFPGTTVANKVTNAMAHCPAAPVPCYLVIDASLNAAAGGSMPSLPSNAQIVDYRVSWPSGPVGSPIQLGTGVNGTALQNALNSLSSTGGIIQLPPGKITGNFLIPAGVTLQGSGYCQNGDSQTNCTILQSGGGTSPIVTYNGSNAIVRNLTLLGYGSGSADIGLSATNSEFHYDQAFDVQCDGFGEECLKVTAGVGFRAIHLFAENTALNHISDVSGKHCAVYFGGTDGWIVDGELTTSANTYGFNSHQVRDALCVYGTNNWVKGSVLETSDDGLYLDTTAYYNKIDNVRADTNGGDGFIDLGVGNSFTGDHAQNNSLGGNHTYYGYYLNGNGANLTGDTDEYEGGTCFTGGSCYETDSFYTPNGNPAVPATITGATNHSSATAVTLLGGGLINWPSFQSAFTLDNPGATNWGGVFTANSYNGGVKTSTTLNWGWDGSLSFSNAFSAQSLTVSGGTQTIYRCTVAGALPIGALTVSASNCGASGATAAGITAK